MGVVVLCIEVVLVGGRMLAPQRRPHPNPQNLG